MLLHMGGGAVRAQAFVFDRVVPDPMAGLNAAKTGTLAFISEPFRRAFPLFSSLKLRSRKTSSFDFPDHPGIGVP